MNRIRAGYCTFPNPFNRKQIIEVSLRPEDVDVIVFWSKDPRPLIPHLDELDSMGLRYYFQFTVNGYPKSIEPGVPQLEEILRTFSQLSERISPEKVIWRYDPILWGNVTDRRYHERRFREIAGVLRGKTKRVVISLVDDYRGAGARLSHLSMEGILFEPCVPANPDVAGLLATMAQVAEDSGMEIVSCAEEYDLLPFGIKSGKCIDDEYIERVFGIRVTNKKDPHQRAACGCIQSKDIGVYGTCRHGCVYCYAVGVSASKATEMASEAEKHNVNSPSLVGWYERGAAPPSLFSSMPPNRFVSEARKMRE